MARVLTVIALLGALGTAACGGRHGIAPTPVPVPTPGGGGDGGDGGTTTPPPPPPPPPTLKVTTIMAFGDSLTYGAVQPAVSTLSVPFQPDAGLDVSYPFKLQTLETARYTSQTITVFNEGVAGNRAQDDRQRFLDDLAAGHPDVVLLMEGDNDLGDLVGLTGSALTAGITAVVNAMEDMVRAAQGRGAVPFVATIPDQRAGAKRGQAAALIAPYNAALKTMIAKKGAVLVDVNAQLPLSYIGADGLHPTEDGYQKLAEIFQSALAAAYEVPPATASVSARR
ncbi:MAG TPA: SGNH/GDSL hydrolase family protein [Vicinamibacterales bacterium]|nr:SGNH/GDSL hydrolase family protein [Vicinamibacterales bacterium]